MIRNENNNSYNKTRITEAEKLTSANKAALMGITISQIDKISRRDDTTCTFRSHLIANRNLLVDCLQ